jgi:hypothetical protein
MKNHVANTSELLPVVRRPRKCWTIPPVDAAERLEKERAEEERLKALVEGTTFDGRMLWGMMNHRAQAMIESGVHSDAEVITMIEEFMNEYPTLRSDWAILFARPRGLDVKRLIQMNALLFADLIFTVHKVRFLTQQQVGGQTPSPQTQSASRQ